MAEFVPSIYKLKFALLFCNSLVTIKDVRLIKWVISDFTVIISNDNLKIDWVTYFISRPE